MSITGSQCSVGLRPEVRYEKRSTDIAELELLPLKPPSKLDAPRSLEPFAVSAGTVSCFDFRDITRDEAIEEIVLSDQDFVDRACNAAAYRNSFAVQRLLRERLLH
jgi:hypothetical protein